MASFVLRTGIKSHPPLFTSAHTRNVLRQLKVVAVPRHTRQSLPLLLTATGFAGAALGISSLAWTPPSRLHCDDVQPSPQAEPPLLPPPKSSLDALELTFGTVCGVYAGVCVKQSARIVAFFLGGLFIVLECLGSASLDEDWARMASRFENLFYTTDAFGETGPPTAESIWEWTMNFLTVDFESFVAGFALGLRLG